MLKKLMKFEKRNSLRKTPTAPEVDTLIQKKYMLIKILKTGKIKRKTLFMKHEAVIHIIHIVSLELRIITKAIDEIS